VRAHRDEYRRKRGGQKQGSGIASGEPGHDANRERHGHPAGGHELSGELE